MNYIDLILGVALAWSTYNGFKKGLVSQAGALIGLLLGVWGAIKFSDLTKAWLESKFEITSQYTSLIAFVVTFIGIVIVVNILAKVLSKTLEALALGGFDKLLGAAFGLLKSALIISIVIFILNGVDSRFSFLPKEKVAESKLYKPISGVAPFLFSYFKVEFDQYKKVNDEEPDEEDAVQI